MRYKGIEPFSFRFKTMAGIPGTKGTDLHPVFYHTAGDKSAGRMLLPKIRSTATRTNTIAFRMKPGA